MRDRLIVRLECRSKPDTQLHDLRHQSKSPCCHQCGASAHTRGPSAMSSVNPLSSFAITATTASRSTASSVTASCGQPSAHRPVSRKALAALERVGLLRIVHGVARRAYDRLSPVTGLPERVVGTVQQSNLYGFTEGSTRPVEEQPEVIRKFVSSPTLFGSVKLIFPCLQLCTTERASVRAGQIHREEGHRHLSTSTFFSQ